MSDSLPTLTRNDLALALFGVQHMEAWWREQPSSGYRARELRASQAINRKLSSILDAMSPPRLCEDDPWNDGDGDEEVYAPTDDARQLREAATKRRTEVEEMLAELV